MQTHLPEGSGTGVSLREVNKENWRRCVGLAVAEDQRHFVSPVSYYLNLCQYGAVWHPFAVYRGDDVVGFVMWAVDPEDKSGWLGGLTIDAEWQGRGLGRATVVAALGWLRDEQGCVSAALSYDPGNTSAKQLYASLGFRETGEMEGDEPVARRPL